MKLFAKKINILLVMCIFMLVASLTGGIMISAGLSANAQEEPKSTVELTSYTSILDVDEDYQFAAIVTYQNGTTSTDVIWSSSDTDIVDIDSTGYASAYEYGTATITATATDGAYASINVLVSETAIRVTGIEVYPTAIEMGTDWTTRIGYNVFPQDAYENGVTWESDDTSVVTVDGNGRITSVWKGTDAAGTALVTATTRDGLKSASCTVTVYPISMMTETTLTPDTLTMTLPQYENNQMSIDLPEKVDLEGDSQWYTVDDSVASIDRVEDKTGTAFAWSFGSTTVYAVAHGTDKKVYFASGTIMVTADFFYITGLESDISDPDENPWKTYETAAEAEAAGVLLVPDPNTSGIYSLTREFWAYDGFQIIHNNMDIDWTTKITPAWYYAEESDWQYVANTADMFMVNALGSYDVTLDLTNGRAKVIINEVDLVVTSLELSVADDSKQYLQGVGDTITLNVATYPQGAEYDFNMVAATISENAEGYVSATPKQAENGALTIEVELLKEPTANMAFTLICNVEDATDAITLTALTNDAVYTPVSSIAFENTPYTINVNNGDKPLEERVWTTPITANVNADASVQGVVYSEDYDEIYIEYDENGQAYVHASALGTYTITATSLGLAEPEEGSTEGKPKETVTTVYVYSENGFYLIGQLNGEVVNNWTSIKPEVTTLEGTAFEPWALPEIDTGSKIFSKQFHFVKGDRFSIAFLGMAGNWNGIINAQYMDWANSVGTYYENDGNVEVTATGLFTVTLDLSEAVPSFEIVLDEEESEHTEYNLYLYVVRGGDAWDPDSSDEGNVLADVGYIHMVDGVAQSFTLTSDPISLYGLPWPAVQFVTATGIVGGYFQDATWYGTGYDGITFGGDWKPEDTEGETNYFTNSYNNSVLYWVGDYTMNVTDITVSFSFTFNDKGVLTNVDVTIVSVTERTETAE